MRLARLLLSCTLGCFLVAGCTYEQHYNLVDSSQLPDAGTPGTLVPADPNADAGGCASNDDPHNCGACGHDCLGGSCKSGACQPVTLVQGEEIHDLAVGDSEAYWIDGKGDVRAVDLSGGDSAPRTPVSLATGFPTRDWNYADIKKGAVTQDAENVYFAVSGSSGGPFVARIVRLSKATRKVDVMFESPRTITTANVPEAKLGGTVTGGAYAIHVAAGTLYWTTWEYVVPHKPDGHSGASYGSSRLFERFYWCPVANCSAPESRALLESVPLLGDGELVDGRERPDQAHAVAIGTISSAALGFGADYPGPHVLLADFDGGKIFRIQFPTQLLTFFQLSYLDFGYPRSIQSDDASVYVTTPMTKGTFDYKNALLRVRGSDSGGSTAVLATGPDIRVVPETVGVDATHVYWSNATTPDLNDPAKNKNAIMRCAKNGDGCGNSPERLATLEDGEPNSPYQLAVRGGAVYWATSTKVMKLALPAPTKTSDQN